MTTCLQRQKICVVVAKCEWALTDCLFTLLDTDWNPDPGLDTHLKMGTVMTGDPTSDRDRSPSLCHVNSFCPILESEYESVSESISGNVNKPLVLTSPKTKRSTEGLFTHDVKLKSVIITLNCVGGQRHFEEQNGSRTYSAMKLTRSKGTGDKTSTLASKSRPDVTSCPTQGFS